MNVHRIQGIAFSSYLIEAERSLFLVDSGFRWFEPLILRKIGRLGRTAEDLRLAVITHPHIDHMGALPALLDTADFDVVAHPEAASVLAGGGRAYSRPRKAWTRAVEWLANHALPLLRLPGIDPTFTSVDGLRLDGYGLPATLYHTPGHSPWCISLLLDDGTAFAGDLIIGAGHMSTRVGLPAMAVDEALALSSMRKLLDAGAQRFFPAHGRAFDADELRVTIAAAEADGRR